MKNSKILANRLREVILNGIWIANTNYKSQLENLEWNIAVSKIESLNSIALLAQHAHYYIKGIKNVLNGGKLDIKDKYSFDFLVLESEKEWQVFLKRFWNDTENLAILIEQLKDETLDQSFENEKYGSYRRNINGLIEHCYYHLGQLVLLKKIHQLKISVKTD